MTEERVVPEHWLVCSPRIHASITTTWAVDADPASLLRLRVESGLVRHVEIGALADRLQAVAAAGATGAHVIVEALGDTEVHTLTALKDLRLGLHLHVWHESALDVLDALRAPESDVLECWSAVLAREPGPRVVLAPEMNAAWVEHYRAALRHWAVEAREDHGEAFDELYPQRPFVWDEFEPEPGAGTLRRHRHARLPALSFAAEAGQAWVAQGLLRDVPLKVSQIVAMHRAAANVEQYRRRHEASGDAPSLPGKGLVWNGSADGCAVELSLWLPSVSGRESMIRVVMSAQAFTPAHGIEIRTAPNDTVVLAVGPPLAWKSEEGCMHALAFVRLSSALHTSLDTGELHDLRLSFLQPPGSA